MLTRSLSEQANSNDKFDFLIMVGDLEHLRDLEGSLAILHRMLSEGARLYVEVLDATQFADWPGAPYQQFSTEHVNFFSGVS